MQASLFASVLAVAAEEGSVGSFYIAWGYLLFFVVCVWFWLFVSAWVAKDAIGVGLRHQRWTSYVLFAGLGPLALLLVSHVLVGLMMIAGVTTAYAFYIVKRNTVVPDLYKLWTPEHFDRILIKLKLRKPLDERKTERGAQERYGRDIQVNITNNEGIALDTLANANPTLTDVTYDVAELIDRAVMARATALQFEPRPSEFAVRARIDGVMHNMPSYDLETGRLMLSLIAFLSGITSAEGKKLKNQGTFKAAKPDGEEVQPKVLTVKTAAGPTLALKFPDPTAKLYEDGLDKLGMFKGMLQKYRRLVRETEKGLILIVSPPQSGRTTTLYASIKEVDVFLHTIVMIEEREEYELDHVDRRFTFDVSKGESLDAIWARAEREDPDIVAIGEIKNTQVAVKACEIARSKLVLTTMQAPDAASALAQMLALGVPGPLLAETLVAVLAQRLVRLLCTECRMQYEPPPGLLAKLKIPPEKAGTWFEAAGCPKCAQIGFQGRTGLFELVPNAPELKQVLAQPQKADVKLIRAMARKTGAPSTQEDGIKKVTLGATSLKEVHRATALK